MLASPQTTLSDLPSVRSLTERGAASLQVARAATNHCAWVIAGVVQFMDVSFTTIAGTTMLCLGSPNSNLHRVYTLALPKLFPRTIRSDPPVTGTVDGYVENTARLCCTRACCCDDAAKRRLEGADNARSRLYRRL